MIGDWEEYWLPRALVSCIRNEYADHLGYLRNLYEDSDQYATIHDFIATTFPGIQPYHAWVGYSKRYPTQDSVHHAVDWYIQHPPEYLTSWYQHYHLTDISTPQEYWQSRVSKHIGMTFFDDTDVPASHVQANT